MSRVPVILHERLGTWSAQLRPRLQGRPVHWIETRSRADLERALIGLACPLAILDLRRNLDEGLADLEFIGRFFPEARVLVLDPEQQAGASELALELGATHVISGFVPPPQVARLIDRWVTLAEVEITRVGWTRPLVSDVPATPDEWLQLGLGQGQTEPI